MFDAKSRYANLATYTVIDHRGRGVAVVPVPAPPGDAVLGIHALRQGERLDHLAQKYLNNSAGFWRICELNDVMLPDVLVPNVIFEELPAKAREIAIPIKRL
jgi:hypothetical protein